MPKKLNERFRAPVLKLNEQRVENRIQVLRTGKFNHAIFGEFDISKKMLKSMVKNFQNNVRGVDLAIDYAHENDQRAAGWITDLSLMDDGNELWAEVAWSDSAMKALDDKEWRYVSAEFIEDYVDNESKKSFGPTLFGAALTNRPFVKGMAPAVELQESDDKQTKPTNSGGNIMPEKQLADLRDDNHKLLSEKIKLENEVVGWRTLGESHQAVSKKLSDLESDNKTLKDAKEKAEKDAQKVERSAKFNEMVKAGKATKAQEVFALSLSDEQFTQFSESAQVVDSNNSAQGTGGNGGGGKSAADEVIELAEKRAEKDGVDISEATSLVLNENTALAKRYNLEEA